MEDLRSDPQSAASAMPQRDLPRTPKGIRTRLTILASARARFAEAGYSATRVQDIAMSAGISLGAFYRYFDSRREVLLAVLVDFFDELYESSRSPWLAEDPRHSVHETTLRYLGAYAVNADLYRLAYETFMTDPDVNAIWDDARQMFYRRIERSLRRGQESGETRPDLDPGAAAILLGGMTEHYAMLAFVVGSPSAAFDVERIAVEISALWVGAVRPTAQSTSPRREGAQR